MKFSEYTYTRPDFDSYQKDYLASVAQLQQATSLAEAKIAVDQLNTFRSAVDTAMNLASF